MTLIYPNRFCDDQPKPSPLDKWCYIDCPVDCALEGWSPWNSSCSCNDTGNGQYLQC